MSPRKSSAYGKAKKEEVISEPVSILGEGEELLLDEIEGKKEEVMETKDVAPLKEDTSFLDIEVSPSPTINPLVVYNGNPSYAYRWCAKNKMSSKRRGIWHTVERDHPDFRGLHINVDDSKGENYFQFRELILCCARKETVAALRKALNQRVNSKEKKMDAETRAVMERVHKEGVKSLSHKTLTMIE